MTQTSAPSKSGPSGGLPGRSLKGEGTPVGAYAEEGDDGGRCCQAWRQPRSAARNLAAGAVAAAVARSRDSDAISVFEKQPLLGRMQKARREPGGMQRGQEAVAGAREVMAVAQ